MPNSTHKTTRKSGSSDEKKQDKLSIKKALKKIEESGSLQEANRDGKPPKNNNKNDKYKRKERIKDKQSQKVDEKKNKGSEGSSEKKHNDQLEKKDELEGSPESNEGEQTKKEEHKKKDESADSREKKHDEQADKKDSDTESTVSRDSDGAPREPVSPKTGFLSWFRFPSRRKEPCQMAPRKCCASEHSKRSDQSRDEKAMQKVMQALLRPQYTHFCTYMKSEIQKMQEECGSLMVNGTYQQHSDRFFKREVKHLPAGTVVDEERLAKRNKSKKKTIKLLQHKQAGERMKHEETDDEDPNGENNDEDPGESSEAPEEGGGPSSSKLPKTESSSPQGSKDAPDCSRNVLQNSKQQRKRPHEDEEDKEYTPAKKRARHT